jgi:hypothetical protein
MSIDKISFLSFLYSCLADNTIPQGKWQVYIRFADGRGFGRYLAVEPNMDTTIFDCLLSNTPPDTTVSFVSLYGETVLHYDGSQWTIQKSWIRK